MPKENCNSNIRFLSFTVLKLIGLLCWSTKLSLEFRVTVHNTESKPLEGKCFWLLGLYLVFLFFCNPILMQIYCQSENSYCPTNFNTLFAILETAFTFFWSVGHHFNQSWSTTVFPLLLHAVTFHQGILSKLLSVNHSQLSHDYNIAHCLSWSDILQTMLSKNQCRQDHHH